MPQSPFADGSPSKKIRRSMANEAALEPTDRKAVIGVGAPSYTSGAHMWKGTAAILKPTPATTRITASGNQGWCSSPARIVAIARRLVVAVNPYRICLLYTSDAADDLLCVDLGGR